jgi:HAD superfamily hydrolase (TIGR01549 family)
MQTIKFNFKEFKVTGENFFRDLVSELTRIGIPAIALTSDHLCFRVSTLTEYEVYKLHLSSHGELLTESLVNGRPISTFRLTNPFQTESHTIELIELPAPKPETSYRSGFEHAEFIIKEAFDHFSARFPMLSFTESGNKSLNPELCLKLKGGKQAKFHHLNLDRVIEIEKAEVKDIIFDLDGTLIRSRENIYEINRVVFSEVTDREISLLESIDKFHPEFAKLFEAFAVTCPLKQKKAISMWGAVSERFSYELFDGVLELLNTIANLNFRIHLWTARDEHSARKILKYHKIERFFATLSFATDVDSKPHRGSLRFDWKAAGKNQVIVIGDSPSDVFGAQNIGALSIGALWDSHTKKNPLISTGAELLFYHPAEFKDWIRSKCEAMPR